MQVSIEITNTGTRAGEEVVQLYVRELVSPIARPVIELKQFQRVVLKPGETREMKFTVRRAQLASLRPDMGFAVNPGTYSVAVGPNSAQLVEARFEVPALKDDRARKPRTDAPRLGCRATMQGLLRAHDSNGAKRFHGNCGRNTIGAGELAGTLG
jgi:hypothetical protein